MTSARYIDDAVRAVHAWYEAHFVEQLPADYERPDAYLRTFLPNDSRLLLQVFDDDVMLPARAGQRNRLWVVSVMVVLSMQHDADIQAGADRSRVYLTALVETVVNDHTLDGTINQVAVESFGVMRDRRDSATRRHLGLKLQASVAYEA